jgi:hypothetical protein
MIKTSKNKEFYSLIEFDIPVKLVSLIKMCLNETLIKSA